MADDMPGADDDVERDLIEWLCPRRVRKVDVTLHSEIYKDLGLNGMDAWEIGLYLNKKHGTDFSWLKWKEYVPGEPSLFVGGLLRLWRQVRGRGPVVYKSLTVRHLVNAVHRGKWLPSSIPGNDSEIRWWTAG